MHSTTSLSHQRKLHRQKKRDNISATNRFVISFCCYRGLGLAHNAFDRSNAMLALSGIVKFSAKNITHLLRAFLCKLSLGLGELGSLGRLIGEDNLVHEEEDYHRYAALDNGGKKVIDHCGEECRCNANPNAVDRVNDYGYNAPCHKVDRALDSDVALAAEGELSLHKEVDNLTEERSNEECDEVCEAANLLLITDHVEGERYAEETELCVRPTPAVSAKERECGGKEGHHKRS